MPQGAGVFSVQKIRIKERFKVTDNNRLFTGKFINILLMALAMFISIMLLTAGLPAHIAATTGNAFMGGMMTTTFMMAAIITRPVIGYAMPAKRMGEGIGYYGIATSGGTSFAPMFALAILQSISYRALILTSVALALVTLVLAVLSKGPEGREKEETAQTSTEKTSFTVHGQQHLHASYCRSNGI